MTSTPEREPDESTTGARPSGETEPVPPPDPSDGTTAVRRAVSDRTGPSTHVERTRVRGPEATTPPPPERPPSGTAAPASDASPDSGNGPRLAIVGGIGALIVALAAGAVWFAVSQDSGIEAEDGPIPKGPEIPTVTAEMIGEVTVSLSPGDASVAVDPAKYTTALDPESSTESSGN